jgi:hypothetical protein
LSSSSILRSGLTAGTTPLTMRGAAQVSVNNRLPTKLLAPSAGAIHHGRSGYPPQIHEIRGFFHINRNILGHL